MQVLPSYQPHPEQVVLLLYLGGASAAAAPVSPLSSTVLSTGVAGTMAAVRIAGV